MSYVKMGDRVFCQAFFLLGFISIALILVSAERMDFCGYDYGAIHRGELHMDDARVMEKLVNIRSKVECATYCYANLTCRTAVYQQDGDCLLISNFTTYLTYDEYNTVHADDIIEMRTKIDMGGVGGTGESAAPDCPSECTGYSVCFLDCSYAGVEGVEPEAMCMDISTTQYTSDGCDFQPHIQSKEYYLDNFDRESANSNGMTMFTVQFTKLFDWTTLQVRFRGSLKAGYGWGGGWGRWRILFDGGHCGNPNWIESINYNSDSDANHYKATGSRKLKSCDGSANYEHLPCLRIICSTTPRTSRMILFRCASKSSLKSQQLPFSAFHSGLDFTVNGIFFVYPNKFMPVDLDFTVNGICYGLAARTWAITLNVEIGAATYMRAGWGTWATRFYVDEIGQGTWAGEPAQHACPSLNDFNYREHVTTTSWGNEPTVTLWNFGYTKIEAGTILRINTDITYRQHSQGHNSATCATWYILIDGGHCSPNRHGKTVANLGNAHTVNNEHRSAESEGHCTGVTAGYHTLSLYLATCNWGTGYLDVYTGWNSCRNRVIINEMRLGTNIAAVMAPDGETMWRLPMLNMVIHSAGHIANGADNGAVWHLSNYNKLYRTSGLRLALSADGRNIYDNSAVYDPCCRHYFLINGNECATPGTIEGIHYLNKPCNLHRMVMIEGICEEIPAGTVTISVYAGRCKGYGRNGECYFGWNSYTHLMIAESFVEREIIEY